MHEVEHAELCIENIKPQMKLIERFGSFSVTLYGSVNIYRSLFGLVWFFRPTVRCCVDQSQPICKLAKYNNLSTISVRPIGDSVVPLKQWAQSGPSVRPSHPRHVRQTDRVVLSSHARCF